MDINYKYKPIHFFSITLLYNLILCPISFYLSHKNINTLLFSLIFIGLLIPSITSIIMIYSSKNKKLIKDFWDRLRFSKINVNFFTKALLSVPIILFLATGISLLFGESSSQFMVSKEINILSGQGLFSILILFLAPLFEELGWRGYGVDSLRAYYNLFKTSIIFGILWTLWHVPLFFIKGYYPNQLLHINIVYAINYAASVFIISFLLNWIYYKNNRSIWAAILFHFSANIFAVLFQTAPFTKCIITILASIILIIIILKDKKTFFNDKNTDLSF
jgi:uncharacterized protein